MPFGKKFLYLRPFEILVMRRKNLMRYRRYALVTGAASGMGRIYCQQLAQKGYNIIMVDINAAGLDETEKMMPKEDGLKVLKVVQDLSTTDAADRIYEVTENAGCEVEVLVNNAGVMYCQGIAETSERMLKLIMMVHMNTPLMLCRKYVGAMKERKCGYIPISTR